MEMQGETHVVGPVRYVMFAFPFTTAANPFPLPSTWAKPNNNQQAQRQCGYPKDEVASPMTTRRAQRRHGCRGKPNDNTASPTLTWMTWQVQLQHSEHNVGMDDVCQQARFASSSSPNEESSVVSHTQPPNDASSPVLQTTMQTASVRMTKPPDDANTPGSCN